MKQKQMNIKAAMKQQKNTVDETVDVPDRIDTLLKDVSNMYMKDAVRCLIAAAQQVIFNAVPDNCEMNESEHKMYMFLYDADVGVEAVR